MSVVPPPRTPAPEPTAGGPRRGTSPRRAGHRRTGRPRSGWAIAGLVVAVLSAVGLVVSVAVVLPVLAAPDQTVGTAAALEPAQAAYPEPAPGQDPTETAATDPAAGPAGLGPAAPRWTPAPGQPLHLVIPSVGLDANVGAMSVGADRRVDPPTPRSAYWLRNYSALGDAATGTAYIAGHTFHGNGQAVFNPLFDPTTRNARIHLGDLVQVTTPEGVIDYTVTAVSRFDKQDVPHETELWQDVPGRLVLVGCWYNGDSSATANIVVYTQRNTT